MALPAALALVTLGVSDVAKAKEFYTALGFSVALEDQDYAVLRTAGSLVALYPESRLADDAGLPLRAGADFRGVSLAVNVASPADVDAALEHAVGCGGRLLRAGHEEFWGGYSGYFADPDGHAWEVAHNPAWPLRPDGMPELP